MAYLVTVTACVSGVAHTYMVDLPLYFQTPVIT